MAIINDATIRWMRTADVLVMLDIVWDGIISNASIIDITHYRRSSVLLCFSASARALAPSSLMLLLRRLQSQNNETQSEIKKYTATRKNTVCNGDIVAIDDAAII